MTIFDQNAIEERRNPLTKQQEKQKRQQVAKLHNPNRKADQVYALCVCPDDPIIFYVGVSTDPAKRFKFHQAAIDLGVDMKKAYEWVRYHKHRDTLFMMVLDEDGELTEEEWRVIVAEQGHPLQNAVGGNDVKRKQRTADPHRPLLKGVPEVRPAGLPPHVAALYERINAKHRDWTPSSVPAAKPSKPLGDRIEALFDAYRRRS